jgi:hypothetical protein
VSSFGVSARCSLSRLGRAVAPVNTLGGPRVDPLGAPLRRDRHGCVRGPPTAKACRDRRDGAQAQRWDARRAHTAGGADRPTRTRRPLQPGDQQPDLHHRPHRRVAPVQGVHQARHQDSLASVQTLVRGPGGHWSGVGSPWPLAASGSRRALASSAPWRGVASVARAATRPRSGVGGRAARGPGVPWKAAWAPRSRWSRRTRSQLPARMLPEALDES